MLIRELSREQCLEFLQRRNLCHLACVNDSQPYIVPIQYSLDAERNCVYGFSTIGQKIAWMRQNPLVCLQVDEIGDKDHWTSVVIFGRYEEIQDDAAETEARGRAHDLFQQRREWWMPAAAKLPSREPYAMVVFRVTIDRLTGRTAARSPDHL